MSEPNDSEYNQERWAAAHRRGKFLTGICIVLAAVIVGAAWYEYPILQRHDTSLHNLSQRLTRSVDSMGARLKGAEAKAADSSRTQQSLREQVNGLGRNLRARIENVSKQASQSAEDAYNRLANVAERVSHLESSREADQVQIAQLRQDVNQVRDAEQQAAVQQSGDLALVRRQMEADRFDVNQQFAAVLRDRDQDRQNIDAIANQIEVRKIPFEATKNNGRDVGDGISLNIENTDTEYRRVSGWIWIASDRRTLWLKDQGAQEPVIFYGYKDGQKRELVFTNVAANSVTGYLLAPNQEPNQAASTETGPAGQ
jgi:hypothetical protein